MSDRGSIGKTAVRRLEANLSQGSLATDLRLLALQYLIFVGHLLIFREELDGELTDALADVAKQDVTERCVSEKAKEEHTIKFKESSYDPCVLSSVDNDDQEKELTCCNADSKPNTSGKHEAVSEKEGTFISEIRKRLCSCFDNLSFKDKHSSKNGRVEEKICPKIISFLVKTAKSAFAVAPKRKAVEKAWNNIRNFFEQNVSGLTNNFAASLVYQPSPKCCEQSSQTDKNCGTVDKGTQKEDEETEAEKEKLEQMLTVVKQELEQLEGEMKEKDSNFKEKARELTKKNDYLETKVNELDKALKANEKELRETLLELGRLSFEHTKMIKEYKMRLEAQKNSLSQQPASQNSAFQSKSRIVLGATLGAESATKHDELTENGNTGNSTNTVHAAIVPNGSNQISAFAVQVSREESSEREVISLGNIPTTTVERGLYNNYKLLILTFARSFLTSDAVALRDWVKRNHSINDAQEVVEIFWELDRKGVISASNLSPLRKFFEKIQRIDLTHLIDSFLLGDYSLLRIVNSSGVPRMSNRMTNRQTQLQSSERERLNPREEERSASGGSNSGNSREVNESFSRSGTNVQDASPKFWSTASGFTTGKDRVYQLNVQRVVATDGAPQVDGSHIDPNLASGNNGTTLSEGSSSNPTRKLRADLGSNGQKLSKFASRDPGAHRGSNPHGPGDDPDDDDDSQWLCNHYKRRCHVKFDCCNKYWPCHRCHNNESNCGEKKLRSRDTKFIKCVRCNTEQPFTEASHNCVNCNMKLAKYFCAICKHLTGTDDNPYHCEKCGICRIHSNRSFHCDVCGVCLDVQLRGNHRCRAGSAHDECCICLEVN